MNTNANFSICAPIIQEKMIEHFTKADEESGCRVREGLANALKDMDQQNVTSNPMADEAVKKAEDMGHDAEPY